MGNLYRITRTQEAMRRLFQAKAAIQHTAEIAGFMVRTEVACYSLRGALPAKARIVLQGYVIQTESNAKVEGLVICMK